MVQDDIVYASDLILGEVRQLVSHVDLIQDVQEVGFILGTTHSS